MRTVIGTAAVAAMLLLTSMLVGSPALAIDLVCPEIPEATPTAAKSTPSSEPAAFPEGDIELTIFAAASLTDAFGAIADVIEDEHPNVSITIETAGSQTLVTQLEQGARADVLATADIDTMTRAEDAELIDGDPSVFATNRLVIVTPADNPEDIDGIDDLAAADVRLVIATAEVPAGQYARTALCDWAGSDTDTLAAIGDNVVSEEIDVRSTLTKVLIGEADAGIVYASDVTAAKLAGGSLTAIEFPSESTIAPAYPIAVVANGNTSAAEAFIAFVLGADGQRILTDYGFSAAP